MPEGNLMPAVVPVIVIAAAITLLVVGGIFVLPYFLDRDTALPPDAVHAADLLERVAAEDSADTDTWPIGYTHQAPTRPLTTDQSHREMQWHRECHLEDCDRKRAAFKTLYIAGEIVPDARSEQYVR
jgi:hypothetical protein